MAMKDERCPVVSTAAVSGLLPLSANYGPRQPEWAKEVILYAAQSIPVGRVFVWNDEENLYVRYLLNEITVAEGWNLSETLMFVDTSSDLSGFWRHHMPGQLNHQEAQDPVSEFTEIISLDGWEPGEDLSITVNGAMAKEDVDEDPGGDGDIFTLQCALSTHFTYRLVKKLAPTELSCFLFDRKTGTILDYDTTGGLEVVIPSEIGGVTVEHVGDLSFLDKGLTSVIIPDTIRSIGEGAFAFNRLTRVIIPDSVTAIGDAAFYSNQLNGVIIPDGVTTISDLTFAENHLTSMVLGKRVATIGYLAFYNNQLASVFLPDAVTIIGSGAFANNHLDNVIIPDSVTTIGFMAFFNNRLTRAIIGSRVTTICNYAFLDNQLTRITIGADVLLGVNIFTISNNNFRRAYEEEGRTAGKYIGTQEGPWFQDKLSQINSMVRDKTPHSILSHTE